MRTLLYLVALVLLVPQLLIFAAIKLVSHLTSRGTLGGIFMASWNLLDLLLGWGGLAVIVISILLFVAAFLPLWRLMASITLVVTAMYSSIVIVLFMQASTLGDEVFFLSPGAIAIAIFTWLIVKQLRSLNVPADLLSLLRRRSRAEYR